LQGIAVMERVLISSCLLGIPVRFNGADAKLSNEIIDRWIAEGRVVSVCPEVSGGFGVPRPAAEIIGMNGFAVLDGFAAVLDDRGTDVTRQFVAGAQTVLQLAQSLSVRVAVLKDGSPSCGRTYIHNGQFRGLKKRGEVGVTTAMLQRNGVAVYTERQIADAELRLRELENKLRRGA
jgi:uncharacterized protein YbbK (DUF523 family)